MKFILGSGFPQATDPVGDWLRVDISAKVDPDLIVDLRSFPWPWDDESVEEVYCAHYVEHQTSLEWLQFVDELWRVLVPGGRATIIHPNLKSYRAFCDPTHLDFIPAQRWLYANRVWRQENQLDYPPYPSCHFGIDGMVYGNFEDGFEYRSDEAKAAGLVGRWDVAQDVMVTLTKKE